MRESYRLKSVTDALEAANRTWGLPRDPPHRDYSLVRPGHVPAITYAASVLLVDPGEFQGGKALMRDCPVRHGARTPARRSARQVGQPVTRQVEEG